MRVKKQPVMIDLICPVDNTSFQMTEGKYKAKTSWGKHDFYCSVKCSQKRNGRAWGYQTLVTKKAYAKKIQSG